MQQDQNQDQNKNQQGGVVAGYPIQDDDIITGATIKSARSKQTTIGTTPRGGKRLGKNKSTNKGISSQRTATGDVLVSSKDAERSVSSPASKQELINLIKSIPDEMLPRFIKNYADIMVNKFGIDTRERVANFFGQVAAESIRGTAEYVYYSSPSALKGAFGSRVKRDHLTNFIYNSRNLSSGNYGYPSGRPTPWQKNGMFDTYYGSRNGNTFNKISDAINTTKNIGPNEPISTFKINPGHYKGSPEGYAYRGHGIIQITGKVQFERMNEYFGKNGKYEKNDIDFLKNPELIHYNWKNTNEPSKFAFLSAMMWWNEHRGVYINKVSIATTKTITERVKGSSAGYQKRHTNVQRYYNWLIGKSSGVTKSIPRYIVTVSPSKIKFFGGKLSSPLAPEQYKQQFGFTDFSNLSFFEPDGSITSPYKDLDVQIPNNPFGYAIFAITKNNTAKIYRSTELNSSVWSTIKYACAGTPILISSGNKQSNFYGSSRFLRRTGRTALGIKPNGDVVVCILSSARLEDVRDNLASQGCIEAINFDGGGSTFAFVGGQKVISDDGRKFPSILTWV